MKQFIQSIVYKIFPPAFPVLESESAFQFEGALRIEWLIAMTTRQS